MWRAHTNATVSITNDTTATLTLGGQTMIAQILSGPSDAKFSTMAAQSLPQDPARPTGQYDTDLQHPGVTVLVIDSTAGGTFSTQVLFTPQWSGLSAANYVTPKSVAVDSWSLTSHN